MTTELYLKVNGVLYKHVEKENGTGTCEHCELRDACQNDGCLVELCQAADDLCDIFGLFKKTEEYDGTICH